MAIERITVPVSDYERSKRFFERALRPLGFIVLFDWPDERRAYLGVKHQPSSLWLAESHAAGMLEVTLTADEELAVSAFYDAAVAAGARTDWVPGIGPECDGEYYAARVLDPDGNTIEAVYRR